MLLVIVGAGASYDSVSTFPPDSSHHTYFSLREDDRLPLANQLFAFGSREEFARDAASFPQCRPIIPSLENSEGGIAVEGVLQWLQDEADEYPERHRQLAAIRFSLYKCYGNASAAGMLKTLLRPRITSPY